jgi:hypothetical protein
MSTTPDQIPRLKVGLQLGIPSGEVSERDRNFTKRDEVAIKWNRTDNDFDIFVDGKWERLFTLMKLMEIFMTKEEFYDHDQMAYLVALHQDVNNCYLEIQRLRQLLGVDLMAYTGDS